MSYLFEPVHLKERPLLYGPTTRTSQTFAGYYHWHQCCEILFIHEGKGTIIINHKKYEMRPGLMFFFKPYQLHKVFATVSEELPYVRTLLFFNPHLMETLLHPFPAHHALFQNLWRNGKGEGVLDLQEAMSYLNAMFTKYNNRFQMQSAIEDEEDMVMLLLQVLEAISFHHQTPDNIVHSSKNFTPFSYSEQVMQWIEEHYAEDIRLEDIAFSLHLSTFYLSKLFRRETGSSISEYIMTRRIEQACRLLYSTNYSVELIASNVGYPNVSYFIKTFKKVMGTTPLKYRSKLT